MLPPIWNSLLGWGAAILTALLFVGLGRCFALFFRVPRIGLAVAFTAGCWFVSILWMAVALDNPLTAGEAGTVLGLCAPPAIWGLWKGPGLGLRGRWPRKGKVLLLAVFVPLCIAWLLPYLGQTLIPDTDWDAAMYHRPCAERFIQQGVMTVDPYRAQLNFPGAVPLLYAGLMALDLKAALTPLNMLGILMLAFGVYEIGMSYFGPRTALWAVALTLTTNIMMELGVDQRSDGFLALFFFACFHVALEFWRNSKHVGLLPLLGIAMGMAVGTKLTGLLAVGMFGGATLVFTLMRRPRRWAPWFAFALVCLIVPGGFWYARNAVKLNDPIYPFLNKELLYDDLHGVRRPFYADFEKLYAKSPKPPKDFLKGRDKEKEPSHIFNLWDVFANAKRYSNKKYHWLQPLLFLAFLLPFVDRRPKAWWIFGAGCLGFLALGARAHLVRYGVSAYPLLALGAAAFLTHPLVRRSKAGLPTFWLALLLTAGFAIHNTRAEWIKLSNAYPLDYLLSKEKLRDAWYMWKVNAGYNGDTTTNHAAHLTNQLIWKGEMPRESLILMVAESKVEMFLCGTIPDVSAECYLWQTEFLKAGGDYETLYQNLRRMGVTHILLNRNVIGWAVDELRLDSDLQRKDYLRFGAYHTFRFCTGYATELFSNGSVELYRLK